VCRRRRMLGRGLWRGCVHAHGLAGLVELELAKAVEQLPGESGMPGGSRYELKLLTGCPDLTGAQNYLIGGGAVLPWLWLYGVLVDEDLAANKDGELLLINPNRRLATPRARASDDPARWRPAKTPHDQSGPRIGRPR
jgi:hypothetical protein